MKVLIRSLPLFLLFIPIAISIAQDAPPAPTATPRPQPVRPLSVRTQSADGITVDRLFTSLNQGQVGLVQLRGDNIVQSRAYLRDREYPFVRAGDGWYALVVADIDAQPRDYQLSVIALQADEQTVSFTDVVTVNGSGFIRQLFEVPNTIAYLTDPAVEREEFARLDAITAGVTDDFYWQDGWQLPLDSEYTSGFGQYRVLNSTVQTRHTGWDQRAVIGTPVSAMSAGTVVFAGELAIRGQYVMIDHGWGVYTGYAHFSQINVQVGQSVAKGQIIGASGNTGRSNGPHLHWEIAVHGEWVDGDAFVNMWLPRE